MIERLSPVFRAGFGGNQRLITAVIGFSFVINLLSLGLPLYTAQLYNRVLVSGSGATLAILSLAVMAAIAVSAVLDDVRTRIFIALGRFFDARLSGVLLERQAETASRLGPRAADQALRDLDTVRQVSTGSGAIALLDLPWSPLFIAACFFLHPLLGALTLFGALGAMALAAFNQWHVSRPLLQSTADAEAGYAFTDALLRHAETVRGMGMLGDMMRQWRGLRQGLIEGQALASERNATIASLIRFYRQALQIAILAAGAWLVIDRDMTAGALFAASIIGQRALMPIDQLVGVWRQLALASKALERVESAFAEPGQPRAMQLPQPTGALAVEDVYYTPPGRSQPVLRAISLALAPGEALGIVGPSAAGKSTLARLMIGAIRPDTGAVRLDGADVFAWERGDFGRSVGYVPQSIELFQGTLRENISRFRETDPLAIVRAAQMAGIHEMILRLPLGYETRIDASGAPLSGGQRQRVALARAVFGDPKFVVFDEPNASLDGDGEAALRQLIERLKANKVTVVMIAHRPSALIAMDKIAVLADGALVDFGPVVSILPRIAPGFAMGAKLAGQDSGATGASA